MIDTKASEFLNDVQAAALINYSPKTLRNYRHARRGPTYHKIGKKILYRRKDLLAWVEKHRIDPEGEAV